MHFIKKHWVLLGIIVLGVLLRFYHNTTISLWHDEAFSALYIKYPWQEMMYRIGLDVHPPFYYIALRFWHYVFGDSLLALRSFSIVTGAAIIPVAYAFVKRAFHNHRAALVVALLTAINPFQLEYVTEVRMYTLGALLAMSAAYFLVRALQTEREYFESLTQRIPHLPEYAELRNKTLWFYGLFALCTSAMMYTHYYLFFTAAALGLYGLGHHIIKYKDSFKRYVFLLASFAVIGLLYLPWLKTFAFQFSQVSGAFWIPKMDVWSIPTTVWEMFLGFNIDINNQATQIYVVLALLFTLFFMIRFLQRTQEKAKWLVVLAFVAPFAGAILFALLGKLRGQDSSVFLVRYFLFASVFYTIAIGVWLAEMKHKTLAKVLLILYAIANIAAFHQYWKGLNTDERPGMAAAAAYLNRQVEPDDKLYIGSSFEFFNFKYYNQTPVAPLLYSGGNRDIKNLPHFAGTAILTNADLLPDLAEATKTDDTVWLLWTNGFGGSKPQVPANWKGIDEKGFADVRPYVGTWIIVTKYTVR